MVQLTWAETAVFLVLLAASVYGFLYRFSRVWRTVLKSKKDPDFTIQPIGRRVWDFVWEVLLQGKVIRQRPLPHGPNRYSQSVWSTERPLICQSRPIPPRR